jgi:hypothetical protein
MAKPKPAADPAIALLVDEIGDLHAQLDPLKPKTARLELLRKSLRKHYEEKAADAYFTAEGLRYSILLGPKENEKHISTPALIKAIGAKVFQRIARVTLTALQAEAPHAIAAEGVITIEPTGTRSLKVLEKGKANG